MTPDLHSSDDTALDLRRSPGASESDAHGRLMKDVIKAQLFPGEAVPATIGRFRVLRPLGAGGMSVVYAAYDEHLDRRIALKLLRSGGSPDNQARLLREAQAMAKLSHPNVVAVHEVGTWFEQVYIAMEFVKGQDLRAWLGHEPRAWTDVVEVFAAAGQGLAAAHQAGLVHRDFKPANVLLGDDGRVRVVDFGLVRQSDDGLAPGPDSSMAQLAAIRELNTTLTQTGAILGTPAYMSPEQHEGRPVDGRSDQFSFCVALYEGLYGGSPFAGASVPALAAEVLAGRIRPVPEDSRVPAWLRRVVVRGLAVDPDARWPSMDELLDALGRDPDRLRRARMRLALVVGGVLALVVALALVARGQADVARVAQRAEAVAEKERRAAQEKQVTAEAERDRVMDALREQLEATQAAEAGLKQALKTAEDERRRAEDERATAEAQRRRAESQRRAAESARTEAERQTGRAVQEARRARDATRLAQALGGAGSDPTTVLALLRETEDPAGTPGWVPAAVDTLLQPVSVAVLRVHRGSVHAAAFSPDGRRVATAGDDHGAALWTWADGAVQVREHAAPVKFLAFGPGDVWASGASDGEVLVGGAEPRRLAHGGELRALALAPDGRRLATASADGRVRVWDLAAGGEPRELRGHTGAVLSAAFDPTGRRLLTAAADGSARVWSLDDAAPPRVLPHPRGAVRVAAFSPDGRRVATGAQDGDLRVWDLGAPVPADSSTSPVPADSSTPPARSQGPRAPVPGDSSPSPVPADSSTAPDRRAGPTVLRGHSGEVVALAWSPDGGALLSASLDGTARVWPLRPGRREQVLRGHAGRLYSAQWSPDGDRVVTASQDGTARVWPLDGGPARSLRGHAEELGAAAFSPDGDHVVTAGRDGSVRVWRVRGTGEEVPVLRPGGRPTLLAWSPDGERLLSARADGVVQVWRPGASTSPRRLAEPGPAPLWLGVSPDGQELRAIREDGVLLRWPTAGGPAQRTTLAPAAPTLTAAALRLDAGQAALATADALWISPLAAAPIARSPGTGPDNLSPGTDPKYMSPGTGPIHLSPGTSPIARAPAPALDAPPALAAGPRTALRGHAGTVSVARFAPDGGALLTGATDRDARLWSLTDLSSGTARVLAPHSGRVTAVAFSPDGARLATGAWDKRARVWPREGEPVVLVGHTGPVWAVAFSPDGARLATGAEDHSVRVWPVDGRDEPVVLPGHAGPVRAVEFRPDGALLASAGDDGTIRLWNADFSPAALQARLRRASPVCLSARQRTRLLGEDTASAAQAAHACDAHPP